MTKLYLESLENNIKTFCINIKNVPKNGKIEIQYRIKKIKNNCYINVSTYGKSIHFYFIICVIKLLFVLTYRKTAQFEIIYQIQ